MSVHTETTAALAYAGLLLAIAEGLALLGRATTRNGDAGARSAAAWPATDVLRFHAALGASLVVLAAFILVVALLRHADHAEAVPLAFGLAGVVAFARRAARRLRPRRPPVPATGEPTSTGGARDKCERRPRRVQP